jgi:ABC-type lipoprotein release transport system permease subunit
MPTATLLFRNLVHFRRTHLAVAAAVAVAGAVSGGALIVGDSVRGSLRDMTVRRLGAVELALESPRFFRAELAAAAGDGTNAVGLIRTTGSVVRDADKARVGRVQVLGVEPKFWELTGTTAPALADGQAAINAALAGELGAAVGDVVLLRIEQSQDIPREALFGKRNFTDTVREIRLTVAAVLPDDRGAGRFTLTASQQTPRTIIVPTASLQSRLRRAELVNAVLVGARAGAADAAPAAAEVARLRAQEQFNAGAAPADVGLRVRTDAARGYVSVETPRMLLDAAAITAVERSAAELGPPAVPMLTHLANAISVGKKSVPYSTVTAVDPRTVALKLTDGSPAPELKDDEILLIDRAAADLSASIGDEIELTYYLEGDHGRLRTESKKFRLRGVVALSGAADDPGFAPTYPGITDRNSYADWNPPFPIDLTKVRARDEDYWKKHRATPKAYVSLAVGRRLWGGRFGDLTAVRVYVPPAEIDAAAKALSAALVRHLPPETTGLTFRAVRAEGLAAAAGATDFGELFLGFSSFLIIAAAVLVALLFRLGVEQRLREIGLLAAIGFTNRDTRRLLAAEGLVTATAGGLVGAAAAVGYGWAMLTGLRTRWVGAVGTTELQLFITGPSLAIAAAAGPILAALSIVWALWSLRRNSPRALLGGLEAVQAEADAADAAGRRHTPGRFARWTAAISGTAGVALVAASFTQSGMAAAGMFFGAGACLLTAGLAFLAARLRAVTRAGRIVRTLPGLAARNAARRPTRSVLTAGLMASAAFIIVSVEAFRQDPTHDVLRKDSGAGGFVFIAETDLPVLHDLNTRAGRADLNLPESAEPLLSQTKFVALRLRPGDDASCRNLYRPDEPRILGVPKEFVERGGFKFAAVSGKIRLPPGGRADAWNVLSPEADGRVPFAVGDESTVRWILHKGLDQSVPVRSEAGESVPLRIAATLSHSIFQSELLIAEADFVRLFPSRTGRRVFLIEPPEGRADEVKRVLNEHLAEFGIHVESTAERLAAFSAVENTYLSTFQALGSLGLLLGTLGLTTVMLRNVLERRGELALLRALGFRRSALAGAVLLENLFLLSAGLGIGVAAAVPAVLPQLLHAGGSAPVAGAATTVALIAVIGAAAGMIAVPAVLRAPLLPALRSE